MLLKKKEERLKGHRNRRRIVKSDDRQSIRDAYKHDPSLMKDGA